MKKTPLLLLLLITSVLGVLLLLSAVASAASVNCSGVTAWVAGGSYTVGELVTYQGSEYKCLQANNNAAPNWDPIDWPGGWSLVGTCTTGPTPTTTATATKTATATATATKTATATGTATRTATATKTATATATATKTATATATSTGTGPACYTAWVSTTAYNGGATVSYSNVNYTAAFWSQGSEPDTNSGPAGSGKPWVSDGACGGGGGTATATATATKTATATGTATKTATATATATGTATKTATATATATSTSSGGRKYAPYQDMSLTGTSGGVTQNNLPALSTASGVKYFTMAFVNDNGGCVPGWGGIGAISSDSTFPGYISTLRASGGDVLVSFGGYCGTNLSAGCGGMELAFSLSCTTAAQVQSGYQAVVTKYSANASTPVTLDFDIEGDAVDSPTRSDGVNSVTLRNQALAALQKANPGLAINYTVPVAETGFTSSETSLMQNAVSNGVAVSVVNIMTMDFGSAISSGQFGSVVTTAANDVLSQMSGISGLNAKLGITMLIGTSDESDETFLLTDAQTVETYAQGNSNVALLSIWELSRDNGSCGAAPSDLDDNNCSSIVQSNWAFSTIFEAFK